MSFDEGFRWFFVALLCATGAAMIALRNRFFAAAGVIPKTAGGTIRARLESAVARRTDPPVVPLAATVTGAGLLATATLGAVVPVAPAVLGAIFYLALGVGVAAGYLRAHTRTGRRTASLRRRSAFGDAPWFLYALPVAQALAALPLVAAQPVTVPVGLGITLALVAAAWRVANAPARIAGVDPEAELFIDERVRQSHVERLLAAAPMPLLGVNAYGGTHGLSGLALAVVTMAAEVAVAAWYFAVAAPRRGRLDVATFRSDG